MDISYQSIKDFDCPLCSWQLHVEKNVWDDFPSHHEDIFRYIELKLNAHARDDHGVFNVNSLSNLELKRVGSDPDYHPDMANNSSYIGLSKDTE